MSSGERSTERRWMVVHRLHRLRKLENPEDNEVATVKVEVTKVNREQSV